MPSDLFRGSPIQRQESPWLAIRHDAAGHLCTLDTGDKPRYDIVGRVSRAAALSALASATLRPEALPHIRGRPGILVTSAIVSGLCLGSMYGLIALGFHVTYVVSNTVNFSQGSSVMLGAVLGYMFAVRLGWPMPAGLHRGPRCCARPSACWWSARWCARSCRAAPTPG